MIPLNPDPRSITLGSPLLGPWFAAGTAPGAAPAVSPLAVPDERLSISIAMPANMRWLPPAQGFFSLAVSTAVRPQVLSTLRQADGEAAFTDNRLIAVFKLDPGTESRISALLETLPLPEQDATLPANTCARQCPRWFAMELALPSPSQLNSFVPVGPAFNTNEKVAQHLGLAIEAGALTNGASHMRDPKRPGMGETPEIGDTDFMLQFNTATQVMFWSFDSRGRAIDPGAVASWFNHLAVEEFTNLWAPDVVEETAQVDAARLVHITNAQEGPVDLHIRSRLDTGSANLTAIGSSDILFRQTDVASSSNLSFSSPATGSPDEAPIARIAALPFGRYKTSADLYPAAPVATLTRDFIRVAAIDIESLLTGQKRVAPHRLGDGTPATAETTRAEHQNRTSTRIRVEPTSLTTHLTGNDAARGLLSEFNSSAPTLFITGAVDAEYGAFPDPRDPAATTLSAFPGADQDPLLPVSIQSEDGPALDAVTVMGMGTQSGGVALEQVSLLSLQFSSESDVSGMLGRVWVQQVSATTGRRRRIPAATARGSADNALRFLIPLPNGLLVDANDNPINIGVDLILEDQFEARLYTDIGFDRPAVQEDGALSFADLTTDDSLIICDQGVQFDITAGGDDIPDNSLHTGASMVVQRGADFHAFDRDSLPANKWSLDTLIRSATATDNIDTVSPAFSVADQGQVATQLNASVNQRQRSINSLLIEAGAPLPFQQRLETAASSVDATTQSGTLISGPTLGDQQESLPHQSGHIGVPAVEEVHSTGVTINGAAAHALHEETLSRSSPSSVDLFIAANGLPASLSSDGSETHWAATLRTVAAGVEAETAITAFFINPPENPFTAQATFDSLRQFLIDKLGTTTANRLLGLAPNNLQQLLRTLDRRLLATQVGMRDSLWMLHRAFEQAEDLVYIESAYIESVAVGPAGDEINLINTLISRLSERPALRVVICTAQHSVESIPRRLAALRRQRAIEAIDALVDAAGEDRVVSFVPSTALGRDLRIASTTVIVDDVVALTGSTHLWRRGLSFDSALSLSFMDERLLDGRPADVISMRRQLLADRLGLERGAIPLDAGDCVALIRRLVNVGGVNRLAATGLTPPQPEVTITEQALWNPDGSRGDSSGFNPTQWLAQAAAVAGSDDLPEEE